MAMARAPDVPKSRPMYTGASGLRRLACACARESCCAVKGLRCLVRLPGQCAGAIRHAWRAGGGSDTLSSMRGGMRPLRFRDA